MRNKQKLLRDQEQRFKMQTLKMYLKRKKYTEFCRVNVGRPEKVTLTFSQIKFPI